MESTFIFPDPGKKTLTAKQIANAIDWNSRTVIRKMKAGKLPRLPGRPFRAYPKDVQKFLESERQA